MRILLVGASGAIGSAVDKELSARHEIIRAGRSSGDVRIDITNEASIASAFVQAGQIDAVISAAGELHFGPLLSMTSEPIEVECASVCHGSTPRMPMFMKR